MTDLAASGAPTCAGRDPHLWTASVDTASRVRPTYRWTEETGRAAVIERSGNRCEICGGPGHSFGHRMRRSQGGLWEPVNALRLCGDGTSGCHGLLGSYGEYAKAGGWEVSGYGVPDTTPVYMIVREFGFPLWVLLGWHVGPDVPPRSEHVIYPLDAADPAAYGLPDRPVMPWEFVEHHRATRAPSTPEENE